MHEYEISGFYNEVKVKVKVSANNLYQAKLIVEGYYNGRFIINHNDCHRVLPELTL